MFKGSNHAELKDAEREHKDQCSHRMISTQNKSVSIHTFIVSGLHWIIELRELQMTRIRCIRAGNTRACFPDRILGFSGAEIPHNCDTSACVTSKVTEVGVAIRARVWAKLSRFGRYNLTRRDIITPLGRREARLGRARGSLRRVIVSELNELMTETSRTVSLCRSGPRCRAEWMQSPL